MDLVKSLVNEIMKFKENFPDFYRDDYEELKEQLIEIIDISEDNVEMALDMFNQTPIAVYKSFKKYAYSIDKSLTGVLRYQTESIKSLRAKRKENRCPNCNEPMLGDTCNNCEFNNEQVKSNVKVTSDNSRHIIKQLEALVGQKNPPSNIIKISDHIITWLTDLHYIYDFIIASDKWEVFHEEFEKSLDKNKRIKVSPEYFQQIIPRDRNHVWLYNTFKIFMNEFHSMLTIAKRLSQTPISNMNRLNNSQIVEVFLDWIDVEDYSDHLYDVDCVFNGYEIGYYLTELRLIPYVEETHVKHELEEILGINLTMEGLMFNFNSVYSKSDKIPFKFNFQQEYIYILHITFHIDHVSIEQQDKEAIIELVLEFNNYSKAEAYKVTKKNCNSPLYCITFERIFSTLKYFKKYDAIIQYLPVKEHRTTDEISKKWFNFTQNRQDIVGKYK
jgi:hypothetical protein